MRESPTPIHRLDATQARAAQAQLVALLVDAVNHGASVGFLRPLSPAAARKYWEDIFDEVATNSRVLLAAFDEHGVTGSVQLGLCLRENGRHRAELQKLLVHTRARRRGLGRALMAAAERAALEMRRTLLYLDTEPDQPAEKMYRLLGWIRAGEIPDYARNPDGQLHPTALFYKRLEG